MSARHNISQVGEYGPLLSFSSSLDRCGTYVRIVLLDFAKVFDLINHEKLLVKLQANDVPPHILRWMGSFLLNRTQQVKIGKMCHPLVTPKVVSPRALYQALETL